MKLYVANTTKQRFTFTWRRLETGQLYHRFINAGAQEMVLDANSDEIDAILRHFAKYGIYPADKIDQSRSFIGKCFSINKPVPATTIEKAMRENDEYLTKTGYQRRQAAALAHSNRVEQELGTPLRGDLEFSAEQTIVPGADRDEPTVNESLVVQSPRTGRGRRGSK